MSFKIALALGGGAARGLSHLGVIRALDAANIPISIITGASIGGIIGASYASHPNIEDSVEQIRDYLTSSRFNQARLEMIKESDQESKSYYSQMMKIIQGGLFHAISALKPSFISSESLQDNLEHVLPKINLEDCAIPLGLTSLDLQSGKLVSFTKGNLIERVMASCAIPGIFPPREILGRTLVDGSWVNPIPVDLARRMGADFVIAVDVAPYMASEELPKTGYNINIKASEASRLALKNCNASTSDFILSVDAMQIHWADFTQLDFCIQAGEHEVEKKLKELKKTIKRAKFKSFFW